MPADRAADSHGRPHDVLSRDSEAEQPTAILSPAERLKNTADSSHTFAEQQIVASRYQIVHFVAAGGMGEVFEAHDLELNERVAIKTVRAIGSTADAIERLKREIQLARRVTHPNVCRIFDIAHHRTAHGVVTFVTMELLRGTTLGRYIRERERLTTEETLPIVRQIAEGLAAAHRAGVVHRDLKSDNVMLVPDGDHVRAVITDFGLARLAAAENDALESVTRPGEVVGTAAYLAPEQCEGQEPSPACDIYALGVIMYEMVTGRRPFPGASLVTTVIRKLREPASSPSIYVKGLDPRWEAAILRCLERDPENRFESALDVVNALTGTAPIRPLQRGRAVLIGGGLLVALAIVAGVLQYRANRDAMMSQPVARQPFVARRSVAIVGFRNTSGRADVEWLSTALAEMLTTELAGDGRLRAISGEEVQRAKLELALPNSSSFSGETLHRIRKNLGADLVVAGSYVALSEQDNEAIRVDVRLQDASGAHPDVAIAETGTTPRLFDLVSRVGSRTRQTLGIAAAPAASTEALRAMPADPAIARLYAEGLARLRGFDALTARDLLERATDADPKQPLVHAALASAWSTLGYDKRAKDEARIAYELSEKLPREPRLMIEAGYHESVADWQKAAEIYRVLNGFFPDNLDYGLRLANTQTKKGSPADALSTVDALRRLPEPLGSDPRIDLAEVDATAAMADYRRMEQAAVRAASKGEARGARLIVARALSAQGVALHRQAKTREGLEAQQRALTIYREAGDRGGIARSLIRIGSVHIYRGEIEAAQKYLGDARAMGEQSGDTWVKAASYNNLAFCAFTQGDPSRAEALLRDMLEVARVVADRKMEATAHDNIGYARYLQGDLSDATEHFTRSVDLARAIRSQQVLAVATTNVGDVLFARGDVDGARMQYQAALSVRQKIGEKRAIAESQLTLAKIAIEEKRGSDAESLARPAIEWATGAKVWDVEALARAALAHALLLENRVSEAEKEAVEASRLADAHENVLIQITTTAMGARVAAARGDSGEARAFADRALVLASRGPLIAPQLESQLARAEVARGSERQQLLGSTARNAAARGFLLISRTARELAEQ